MIDEQFRVARFVVENRNTTSTSSALMIELAIRHHPAGALEKFGSTTVVTTASLRSY